MKLLPLVFALVFLLIPSKVEAIVKFNTEFKNYYVVDSQGQTNVTFVVNQKNNLSVVYATEFGLSINETNIQNVRVSDEGVAIVPEVTKTLNQTTISFPFKNKVVGKDKNHQFIIEYQSKDIAIKKGNSWQINIPRINMDENISNYDIILQVPNDFPKVAYIDPAPEQQQGNTYYFTQKNLGGKAISAVFGDTEYYQMNLRYHLSNQSEKTTTEVIALPPDTPYQKIFIQNISDQPNSIYADHDGNYLAEYTLKPNSDKTIFVEVVIRVHFKPQHTSILSSNYTESTDTWNYQSGVFQIDEISKISTPKAIYDYVVDKFVYDYEKVNRQKSLITPAAESFMNHQSAICTDFSNVFIALARKANIHSREIQGIALSDNPDLRPQLAGQDVLHSWVEYYNQDTGHWIQIDPTWENTTRGIDYFNKLDLNHIALVIHGTKSDFPIPAGGYKKNGVNTKDIEVKSIGQVAFPDPILNIEKLKTDGNNLNIQIKNNGKVSYIGSFTIQQKSWINASSRTITIPPSGNTIISLPLSGTPLFRGRNEEVIINFDGYSTKQSVYIAPAIPRPFIFTAGFIILAGLATLARSVYLRRRKQKSPLHREIN